MGRTKYRSSRPFIGRKKKVSKRRMKKEDISSGIRQPPLSNVNDRGIAVTASASSKKLSLFGVKIDDFESHKEINAKDIESDPDSYLFVQEAKLSKLFSNLLCPICKQAGISFVRNVNEELGFAAKVTLKCTMCHDYSVEDYLSKRVGESGSNKNAPFDVNIRATVAFRGVGCGHAAMKEWCGIMNIPSLLSKGSYINTNNKLEEATKRTFNSVSQQTREVLSKAYSDIGVYPDEDGVLDIAVSFDGTWQKRGHTSHNGAASTIDLLTGLPTDIEVLSNYCSKCAKTPDREKTEEWKEAHAEVCLKNFDGTAGAMEVEAARRIWQRSVQEHKLRYTTMLCDGDSKAFDAVVEMKVYGDNKTVEKEDCINHVSKRMGTALRDIVAVCKAQKNSISGKGKLTQTKIKRIQNYYGKAIKDNAEDTTVCKKRIMAILLHLSSTDTNPKHVHCPPGETSWCFWQRAKAKGEEPSQHKEHDTLPPAVGSKLVPIFQRLSEESLLKRCARKKTQNPNESFHQIIWKLCPKSIYVGRKTLQTAVAMAACQFSMGASFKVLIFQLMGMEVGECVRKFSKEKDRARVRKAERASSEVAKRRRKTLKYNCLKNDEKTKQSEGKSYGAGLFNA